MSRPTPSTVAHVLRLVGSSYLEAGPSRPSRAIPRVPNPVPFTPRRFASSAHVLADDSSLPPYRAAPLPVVRTPRTRGTRYEPRKAPQPPQWSQLPEGAAELFSEPLPFPDAFIRRWRALRIDPTFLLPVTRLEAIFKIFSSPETERSDWEWLEHVLAEVKDQADWSDLPGSESLFRLLRGLAIAHSGEWGHAGGNVAMGTRLALASSRELDYFPRRDLAVLEAYVKLAREAGQVENVCEVIRFSGQKLHKLLAQQSGTMMNTPYIRKLQVMFHEALNELEDPVGWISTQQRPGRDGRQSRAVYHLAIVVLTALANDPSRTTDAFAVWRHVVQRFNSTFIPAATASLLAVNLAKRGYPAAAHNVLTALHESCPILPHSSLSRELWIYAEQGRTSDARRLWGDITQRYGPTRADRLALATSYAEAADLEGATETLMSLFGSEALRDADALTVLVRASVAKGDVEGALRYLNEVVEIRPSRGPFLPVLSLLASRADSDGAVRVFEQMLDLGIEPSLKAYTTLISAFANAGEYFHASQVFDAMVAAGHKPDAPAWAALINGAIEAGQFTVAADKCSLIPPHMLEDASLATTVLKAFVLVSAPLETAMRLFRRFFEPSPQAWALIIQSAADHRNLALCRTLFEEMDARVKVDSLAPEPNAYVFSILLAAYLRSSDRESARAVYDLMIARDIVPTSVTYGIITSSFANSPGESSFEQAHNFAMSVYDQSLESERTGSRGRPSENVFGPLLAAAGRTGDIDRAIRYYELIKESSGASIVISTKLMDAYRRVGKVKPLYRIWLRLFKRAVDSIPRLSPAIAASPIRPAVRSRNNILCVPLSITIKALADAGEHNRLKDLWRRMRTSGFGFDAQNYNHYAVALAQTGDVEGAFHIVDRVLLPRYDEVLERLHLSVRTPEGIRAVDPDSAAVDELDEFDAEDWPSVKSSSADADHTEEVSEPVREEPPHSLLREAAEHSSFTVDDAADPSRRPPNRRGEVPRVASEEMLLSAPAEYLDSEGDPLNMDVLRLWRPTDLLWRPNNATIAVLDQAYRQLEDQRAYRAWMGLASSDEADPDFDADEVDGDVEQPEVTLPEFGNVAVKNQDGTSKRMSPKLMVARLNRKYARVVGLVMLHRRKRLAAQAREKMEHR